MEALPEDLRSREATWDDAEECYVLDDEETDDVPGPTLRAAGWAQISGPEYGWNCESASKE